jgi:Major Facilitator Superfamily
LGCKRSRVQIPAARPAESTSCESGLATGIVNSSTTLGAVAAPIMVPLVAANYGWRGTFILTGAIGMLWLLLWWPLYFKPEAHPFSGAPSIAARRSESPLDPIAQMPPNVGACGSGDNDVSDLQLLSVLASQVLRRELFDSRQIYHPVPFHRVRAVRRGFDSCGTVVVRFDSARLDHQSGAENSNGRVCVLHAFRHSGQSLSRPMDRHSIDRRCVGRTSRNFLDELHDHHRYVPQPSRRIGVRHRRVLRHLLSSVLIWPSGDWFDGPYLRSQTISVLIFSAR